MMLLVLFDLWQPRDVVGSIFQRHELQAAGQRDRIFKRGGSGQRAAQAIGFWRANEATKAETAPARKLGVRVPEPSPCAP